MADITSMPLNEKIEIAKIIRSDTLSYVNQNIELVSPPNTFYVKYGKRILDFSVAFVALLVSLPINLLIGVVTFFDVGRPLFFHQERVGKDEVLFELYKFRNMREDRDSDGNLLPPSQRVTKWGKFVRKTSLDELLNFVSILKGDMSIIGPRALPSYYKDRFNNKHRSMYKVRPGLECPTISKNIVINGWEDRLNNYVWYVENVSFKTDILLIIRLFEAVFDKKNNAVRASALNSAFMGYDKMGKVIDSSNVPDKYLELYRKNS